ncbi:hypothetical protein HDV62DRAFT_405067 [Trichoderma sp. SZMC 28011]
MKTFNWITVYVLALSATSCNAQLDNFPTVYDDQIAGGSPDGRLTCCPAGCITCQDPSGPLG